MSRRETGTPPEDNSYARALDVFDPLRRATIGKAIEALDLPPDGRGLDVGCGIGLQDVQILQVLGEDASMVGLDNSEELLDIAKLAVKGAGLAGRTEFVAGDLYDLPFEDGAFDWSWSCDCVGYGTDAPAVALGQMARVVRPGGKVAIASWSSQNILPGHPELEARLDDTAAGIAPFRRGMSPEQHQMMALSWFRELGLENASARSFVGEAQSPLTDRERDALVCLFGMRWPGADSEVRAPEWEEFLELTTPGSPGFILARDDYYAFFTYTMFSGTVPE